MKGIENTKGRHADATTHLRRRKKKPDGLRTQAYQLLNEDRRSVSEEAPLQDGFRERCGRPAVKIMRIEISFRRDGQAGNIIKKRHQLSDDVLELR